ncbi:transcription factor [Gloeocapsa sp. PCC 7428]|nr:transcription factor [Gloeocapsa sp. PCC 7428]
MAIRHVASKISAVIFSFLAMSAPALSQTLQPTLIPIQSSDGQSLINSFPNGVST